ncbi:TPA: hypothetical protein ACK4BK_001440, partial [Neisseria gonorrhoeae]
QNPRSLIGHALPLLIPRYRCRLNLQTAFLIARRLQARGGRGNTRTVIPDNTVISKPVRQHRNLETRHSRAGGNPDLSARKLIG